MQTLLFLLLISPFSIASECEMGRRLPDAGPAEELYNSSRLELKRANYCKASHFYQEVILQHPFSQEAKLAQLEIIFSLAKANNFEESVQAAEDYLLYFPNYSQKNTLLRFIEETKEKGKRYASQRRLRLDEAEFSIVGLPKPMKLYNSYEDPEEAAFGGMIQVKIPF